MLEFKEDPPQKFIEEMSDYPPVIAKLLWYREVRSKAEAERYLNPKKEDLHDPFLLRNMKEAVERTKLAIEKGEHIVVVGDFDTDGISGAATLARSIVMAGGELPSVYIPNHFKTGIRGLSWNVLKEVKKEDPDLLIAVDIGTNAQKTLQEALNSDIDAIVIDHHRKTHDIPEEVTIVNPQLEGATYPFPHLSACGLAFKFSQALLGKVDDSLLAYAAVATIADRVVLVNENRVISKLGRDVLKQTDHPPLRALLQICELHVGAMAERINSSIEKDGKNTALALLLEEDLEKAKEFAFILNKEYWRRVSIIEEATKIARRYVKDQTAHEMIIARDENFVPEIRGIIASRTTRIARKPALICKKMDGFVRGSLRCSGEVNLVHLLSECEDLLESFGGHPNAAGFSVSAEKFEEFVECLRANENMIEKANRSMFEVDAQLKHVNPEILDYLDRMKPYGMQNPVPILLFVPK